MAFLDNLDKKLTELGQGALQKTQDATDSVKISSSIKGMENQKKECFEQIGKIYYEKYADKAAEAMAETAELIAKINELETAEEELREQMRKIKGTIYCPNCNAEISENSKFCNVCGAKIELPEKVQPVQSPTGKVCKNCGAALEEGQMFCVNCGTKVEEEAAPQEYAESAPQVQPVQEPVYETPVYEAPVCPNCGKELREGQKFCTGCGTPIG